MKICLKIIVVLSIIVVPSLVVAKVNNDWKTVLSLWAVIGSLLACMFGFWGATWLLRKALIFLGMKPETADREYGAPGYWWWR